MKIPFDLPHVYPVASTPTERNKVASLLRECCQSAGSAKTRVPTVTRFGKTQVMFDLPNRFQPESHPSDNARALQALLHCLIAINTLYLLNRPWTQSLYDSGVYYDRTNVWDSIPALYSRGYGDCKSLSAARIAEYLVRNIPASPVFRSSKPDSDGNVFYHILVLAPNGWEDPSKVLGMGMNENAYFQTGT